jgi:hypothetical protein
MQDHNESVAPSETVDQKSVSVREAVAKQFRPTIPLLILPTLHLILCFVTDFTISDESGGWKWFLMGLIDFPLFVILRPMSSVVGLVDPFLVFAILGTLWWYFVSVLLRFIFGVRASVEDR